MNKAACLPTGKGAPGKNRPRRQERPERPRGQDRPRDGKSAESAPGDKTAPGRPAEQAAGPNRAWRRRRRAGRRTGPGRRRDPPALALPANPASRRNPAATRRTAPRAAPPPCHCGTVRLLDSPFRQNQARNTTYQLFLDPERMLRSFRLNYGEPSAAEPLGGWEKPDSQIRGHMTGHLLSGLALTYANTSEYAIRTRSRYLVSQLAALQALGPPPPGSTPATCPLFPRSTSTGWSRESRSGRPELHDPQVPGRDDRPVPAGR